ncbi:MAG TPA: hypothetical protein DEO32_01620 [Ruminococcaceae bacterium]|nr:hypothetical protein [Oscillospiraceae bacterium]
MTPEEKHRKKRYNAYAVMILGILIIIAGCTFLYHYLVVVLGMLVLFAGFIYKSKVDRKYREEVFNITQTPEIDFSAMEYRHKDDE